MKYNLVTIRFVLFFFSSRRRHTRSLRDWSSDVCSSDLFFALDDPRSIAKNRKKQFAGFAEIVKPTPERNFLPVVFSRLLRSEERRVGKECRSRWSPYH